MNLTCRELIHDLLADPIKFHNEGHANALLQTFFDGEPVEILRPLLHCRVSLVQHAVIFVASELGKRATPLIGDVIPLMYLGDRYVRFHATEILAVCAVAEHSHEFAHVVQMLDSQDEVLRRLAMFLMSRVDIAQLAAARCRLAECGPRSEVHVQGLCTLESGSRASSEMIKSMIISDDAVVRRYGAIAAHRLARDLPELVKTVLSSDDPDLREFSIQATEFVE